MAANQTEKGSSKLRVVTLPYLPSDAPEPYFFYGSLMGRSVLGAVAGLSDADADKLLLAPATVSGYCIKMWGRYPALVRGSPQDVVEGLMYTVPDRKTKIRLAEYETSHYRAEAVEIHLRLDGGQPSTLQSGSQVTGQQGSGQAQKEGLGDAVTEEVAAGTVVMGKTFVWAEDESILKGGTFDKSDFLH